MIQETVFKEGCQELRLVHNDEMYLTLSKALGDSQHCSEISDLTKRIQPSRVMDKGVGQLSGCKVQTDYPVAMN